VTGPPGQKYSQFLNIIRRFVKIRANSPEVSLPTGLRAGRFRRSYE
jgi:hypothetical protein